MKKNRSELRNRFEYGALVLAERVAARLGPRPLARIGGSLGDLFHLFGSNRRKILRFNLKLAFPEFSKRDRDRLARRIARHFGRMSLDTLRLHSHSPEQMSAETDVAGLKNLDKAVAAGQGIFTLSAHIGSWEVAGLIGGKHFKDGIATVNRPLDNPYLEHRLAEYRSRFGNVSLGKKGIARSMMTRLKNGRAVGMLIDQRPLEHEGIEVPFFGQQTLTHTILARLVKRTMVPVLPIFGIWNGPGSYTVEFGDPVMPETLSPDELEEEPLTTRFSKITEAIIREHPEQWLWYHDRWRELRLGSG